MADPLSETKNGVDRVLTRMAARGRKTSTATEAATRAPGDTGTGPWPPSPTVESIIAARYRAVVNCIGSSGSASEISWDETAGGEEGNVGLRGRVGTPDVVSLRGEPFLGLV